MPPLLPGVLSQLTPAALASSLKADQLRRIARALGAPSSGIKASLANGIYETLGRSRFPPAPAPAPAPSESPASLASPLRPRLTTSGSESHRPVRILSVDIGIRNLAVCLLEIRPSGAHGGSTSSGNSSGNSSGSSLIPHIIAWQRMSIPLDPSTSISTSTPTSTPTSTSTSAVPPHTVQAENAASAGSSPGLFSKLAFSHHAYNLSLTLLNLGGPDAQPDQVIIETQRYRSQAGAAVLEWTLRVNMLEDMLWGCLRTLENLGVWGALRLQTPTLINGAKKSGERLGVGGESIMGVSPAKVANFWDLCMEQYSAWEWKGKENLEALWYESKRSKTRIVAELLHPMIGDATLQPSLSSSDSPVPFYFSTAQAMETANLFRATEASTTKLQKSKKKRLADAGIANVNNNNNNNSNDDKKKKKQKRKGPKGKLDDLADCFLQGLAWVKWEEERRRILSGQTELEVFKKAIMGSAKSTSSGSGPKTKPKKRERKPVGEVGCNVGGGESLGQRGETKKQKQKQKQKDGLVVADKAKIFSGAARPPSPSDTEEPPTKKRRGRKTNKDRNPLLGVASGVGRG